MADVACAPVVVLATAEELPAHQGVWGSGGWTAPENREALDWLTLCRLLGWETQVLRPGADDGDLRAEPTLRCAIVALDPRELPTSTLAQLIGILEKQSILVIARAAPHGTPLAKLAGAAAHGCIAGRSITWLGPGPRREWGVRGELTGSLALAHRDTAPWALLDGSPLISARPAGRGTLVTLGAHPGHLRDAGGTGTALLRQLLVHGTRAPSAWFELDATLVLRMDDPGGAENVHHRAFARRKLDERQWDTISRELQRRSARMSVGYVAGWVDDADASRGRLEVGGKVVPRVRGAVHPSPRVRYHDLAGNDPGTIHDYASEYRGLLHLRSTGCGDLELHGYTHMHPDTESWAAAPDRYDSIRWYRELGAAAEPTLGRRHPADHPLTLGMAAIRRFFDTSPTTLICPGDEWTNPVLERALELGLQLVSSYYLALRIHDRFCWSTHVCAPYLDRPDENWFESDLPVVGYFHDFDVARNGVEWFSELLDDWTAIGAKRFMDFRELAGVLGRTLTVEESGPELRLVVESHTAAPLIRPVEVLVRHHPAREPLRVIACFDGVEQSLPAGRAGEGLLTVRLPAHRAAATAERRTGHASRSAPA